MAGIAAAIIGAGALGAGASIFGSITQKNATDKAMAAQQGMFGTAMQQFQQASANEQPFIQAGTGAAGTLADLLKPGADMSSILKNIPGFDFINKITQQGVSNQGTVTGLGGNTLLAGANAGSNVALSAGWGPIVNALQGLTSTGVQAAGQVQSGASALGGQAVQTGANVGSSLIGGGNAIAAGTVGASNALGGAFTTNAILNALKGNGMYATAADAGLGGPSAIGSGGYNFLDKQAGTYP